MTLTTEMFSKKGVSMQHGSIFNTPTTHRARVSHRKYEFGWRVGNNGFLTVSGKTLHVHLQEDITAKGEL